MADSPKKTLGNIDRRQMLMLSATLGAALYPGLAQAHGPDGKPMPRDPDLPEIKVGMLVYPRMILLDLVAPMTVLNILRADIQLIGKTTEPASTDVGLPISPHVDFSSAEKDVDILFVPGGIMGTIDLMKDPETLDFVANLGARAKYVTSVCTGSLVLGAAGLLDGYNATSHWGVADLLPTLGANRVDERVVIDRNRVTGGGATAGLDFGLALASQIYGEEQARRVQLILEYAPDPPFQNGTPEEAGPERLAQAREKRVWMDQQAKEAAQQAATRLGL